MWIALCATKPAQPFGTHAEGDELALPADRPRLALVALARFCELANLSSLSIGEGLGGPILHVQLECNVARLVRLSQHFVF